MIIRHFGKVGDTKLKEYFKGVVWPHEPVDGPQGRLYRYVVMGILVTDTPIEKFEFKNELVLDGSPLIDLSCVLAMIPQRASKVTLGDATDVILNLKSI